MRSISIFTCFLLVFLPLISYAECKTVTQATIEQGEYKDRTMTICGTLTVSSYYNYEYREAQATYVAYKIKDDTGTAHLYAKRRSSAGDLWRNISKNGGKIYGYFYVQVPHPPSSWRGTLLGELVGYTKLGE